MQSTQAAVAGLHWFRVASVQSASFRHSTHPEPTQNRCAPEPAQGALEPQRQVRFEQVLATSGSHAPEHAEHWVVLVPMQAATPPLSQQS